MTEKEMHDLLIKALMPLTDTHFFSNRETRNVSMDIKEYCNPHQRGSFKKTRKFDMSLAVSGLHIHQWTGRLTCNREVIGIIMIMQATQKGSAVYKLKTNFIFFFFFACQRSFSYFCMKLHQEL